MIRNPNLNVPKDKRYILTDDLKIVHEPDDHKYTNWIHTRQTCLAFVDAGPYRIKTLFTCQPMGDDPDHPLFWITHVWTKESFWDDLKDSIEIHTERYETKEQAQQGHDEIVEMIKNGSIS